MSLTRRTIVFIQTILVAVGVLLTAAVLVTSSLWFMWGLLPEGTTFAVAFNRSLEGGARIEATAVQYGGQNGVAALAPFFRVVYGHTPTGQVLIVAPRITHQLSAVNSLRAAGWQVRRYGLLLRATKGYPAPAVGPVRAAATMLRRIAVDRLPWRPLLIAVAQAYSWPAIDRPLTFFATWHSPQLRARLAFSEQFDAGSQKLALSPTASAEFVQVVVPGKIIAHLPTDLRKQWNSLIQSRLALTKTKPDIIAHLSEFDWVQIIVTDDTISLGVVGQSERFAELLISWFGAEEAYLHPVRRAFRLPDGSLGYEQIPGQPPAVFSPAADNTSCRQSQVEGRLWQVCRQGQMAVLAGTNDDIHWPSVDQGRWQIIVPAPYTKKLNVPLLRSVVISGDTATADITLQFDRDGS